ncbi:hypothetical protein D0869_12302 [Hortaea werneckii]|uniref:Las1-domain-containing protein n=1 Tax=Hortaea werneckii TaxID=91943 RepID=A0A3M6WPN8_HORWE|nr:hypothetical protein KC324_g2065 [Hortaea werneckii]KAI7594698.1 hypothetical protein KC316_g972 [Hortaea werneckii]RMX74734.1 hypothetical protein D0869_12302 [Hortaea werneckii]RMX80240.1 hypothetical protein D0868_16189 [Hortaea werneckii]
MPRYTITPWRHQRDLLEVRAQLYPQHTTANQSTVAAAAAAAPQQQAVQDMRRHAVDRILAWKLRGNLPHAVESTALLVDAILHHQQQQQSQQQQQPQPQTLPPNTTYADGTFHPSGPPTSTPAPAPSASTFAIRAVYSAAFTRFVTGFCDIGRSRASGLTPASMLEIARQIEMPASFVGLRHEATHEELPALGRLVGASAEALEWLWGAYWSRLGEEGKGGSGEGQVTAATGRMEVETSRDLKAVREEAGRLMRSYRGLRREAFKRKRQGSREHRVEVETVARACGELCGGGGGGGSEQARVHAVVGVLVDERLLLPSNRELGSAMGPAITLWSSLLDLLATSIPDFRPTLIRHALSVLSSADAASAKADQDADAEGLYLWTRHFLESEGERGAVLALRWCCLYPGYWTRKLGEDIVARSDDEFVHVWKGLFESSALRDADPVVSEAVPSERQQEVEMNGSQDGVRGDISVSGSNELGSGGWRRAVVPPSVPIGVVA